MEEASYQNDRIIQGMSLWPFVFKAQCQACCWAEVVQKACSVKTGTWIVLNVLEEFA